jgi:hypothetical protein
MERKHERTSSPMSSSATIFLLKILIVVRFKFIHVLLWYSVEDFIAMRFKFVYVLL